MKNLFKLTGTLLILASVFLISCAEDEIAPPDSTKPIKITFDDFLNGKYLDQAVQIDSVYFEIDVNDTVGHLFNGSSSNANGARTLSNCSGKTLIVHTSPDRDFAYLELPTGMGAIYGVASEYQGTKQLLLRTFEDVSEMTKAKCETQLPIVTISQILAGEVEEFSTVQILNVEYLNISDTWGSGRTIQDCDGNQLTSYVASSESFVNNLVPQGNGALIGVLENYKGTTWEIKPRSNEDGAAMTNPLCGGGATAAVCEDLDNNIYLIKDFEDNDVNSCSWITFQVQGTLDWGVSSFGDDSFAKVTNYDGNKSAMESWFISPAVDLSSATAPKLSFDNLVNYAGDSLTVMISTDYDGSSDPTTVGTWTDLTAQANWDIDYTDWGNFLPSGDIDVSAHISSTVYIAFIYKGAGDSAVGNEGSTWELDNILIKE